MVLTWIHENAATTGIARSRCAGVRARPPVSRRWLKKPENQQYFQGPESAVRDKGFYSVHFTLIGQKVWVRIGARVVEIFQHGKVVAAHQRVQRPWQRRTIHAHRPPAHRAYLELDYGKLLDRAQRIGTNTAAVVVKQALNKRHLDETVRGALGILRLAGDFTPEALERACGVALSLGLFNYRAVRDLLRQGGCPAPQAASASAGLMHDNVRGTDYFSTKTTRSEDCPP
jgi:hypothetical protein